MLDTKMYREYTRRCDKRKERVKKLTEDSDYAYLEYDNEEIDSMLDSEILKDYKHWKKANPDGINWEEE